MTIPQSLRAHAEIIKGDHPAAAETMLVAAEWMQFYGWDGPRATPQVKNLIDTARHTMVDEAIAVLRFDRSLEQRSLDDDAGPNNKTFSAGWNAALAKARLRVANLRAGIEGGVYRRPERAIEEASS